MNDLSSLKFDLNIYPTYGKNYLGGVLSCFIQFLHQPAARPTFVSIKVDKTIVICKTCSFLGFIQGSRLAE